MCGGPAGPKGAPLENVEPPASPQRPAATGRAREIQRTADGGEIELEGDRAAAMADADARMAARCGGGRYTITEDGEKVVESGDSGELPLTAWRVRYVCTAASH